MTMNYKSYILSIIAIIAIGTSIVSAQNTEERQRRWMSDMREYKNEFLTREMELSQEQQDKFFPLYSAMEDEVYQLNKESRELERKVSSADNVSGLEYEATAKAMLDVKDKEAKIEATYFEKFKEILSAKQLFLLKRAETRFSRNMLNMHRDRKTK